VATNVPRISERLRNKLSDLSKDLSPLVEHIHTTIMQIDGYESLPPTVQKDIFESMFTLAELWFQSLLSGSAASSDVMDALQDTARRRVHQRVPLQSILRAFQWGSREIWRINTELAKQDPALMEELLFEISPYLFDYFDVQAQNIAQAYLAEQYQQARWRESLMHQLYGIVFHTPDDVAGFTEVLEALGLDPTLPRVALAIDADLQEVPVALRKDALDKLALIIASQLGVPRDALLDVWYRGRYIVWIPCVRGDMANRSDHLAAEHATRIAAAESSIRSIGIGLMHQLATGWASSVEEAFKAIDFSQRDRSSLKVRRYSSIAIQESVRGTANVLQYVVSLLEQLAAEADLLATLSAYFEHGQRRKPAADALGIHPNTLNYRLERIETVLGASLNDAEWIAKLDIALKLRRFE